jgi:putative DNA primase/helicase
MALWSQTNLMFEGNTQSTKLMSLNDITLALMRSPTPETPREIAKLRTMLGHISSDCSYEVYRNVVWALLSTDWDCAEQLALDWSMTTPHRYEEATFFQLINSFNNGHLNTPTMGSIYHLARAGGWDG